VRGNRRAIAASARRLDDEDVARLHLDRRGTREFDAIALDTLDPVAPDGAKSAATKSKRRDPAMVRKDRSRHRLQESNLPNRTVAAMMPALASRTAANREFLEAHRESPFQHLRIGQA